jgi:hypothetical protein
MKGVDIAPYTLPSCYANFGRLLTFVIVYNRSSAIIFYPYVFDVLRSIAWKEHKFVDFCLFEINQ